VCFCLGREKRERQGEALLPNGLVGQGERENRDEVRDLSEATSSFYQRRSISIHAPSPTE
jgi:hypothetical protein